MKLKTFIILIIKIVAYIIFVVLIKIISKIVSELLLKKKKFKIINKPISIVKFD